MAGYLLVAYDSTTQCLVHLQCSEIVWNYGSNSRKYRKKTLDPCTQNGQTRTLRAFVIQIAVGSVDWLQSLKCFSINVS